MVKNFVIKLNGKKLIILTLLAIAINEIGTKVVFFISYYSSKYGIFGLDTISNQFLYCLKLALPIYILSVLIIAFLIDKKILTEFYDKNHRIFFWILLSLFVISSIAPYLYIFNTMEYTVENFLYFESSICLK